jgi:hypothetical protein
MPIQRRRRQPQAGSQSAQTLENMMAQFWPMLLMGMQQRQRAGETAAGRAHSAEEARKSRLFQERQAEQRQDWTRAAAQQRQDWEQAERDEELAQRGREWAGEQIGPTTGPDELGRIATQAAQRFRGANIGELSMLPQTERLQAAVGRIGGATGGEAGDPGYPSRIATEFNLGPLADRLAGPELPLRPPWQAAEKPNPALDELIKSTRLDEEFETPAGATLLDTLQGRRDALTRELDHDVRRAGRIAEATAQGQLPSALTRQADQAGHARGTQQFGAELAEQTQARTPTEVEYTGVGIPYPGGEDVYLKVGDQYHLVNLHRNWTGSLMMLPEKMPTPDGRFLSVVTSIRPEGDSLTPEQAGIHAQMLENASGPNPERRDTDIYLAPSDQASNAARTEADMRILEDAQALAHLNPATSGSAGVQHRPLFSPLVRRRSPWR